MRYQKRAMRGRVPKIPSLECGRMAIFGRKPRRVVKMDQYDHIEEMGIIGSNGRYESIGPGSSGRRCDDGEQNRQNPIADNAGMHTCDRGEISALARKELNRHDREIYTRRNGRIAHLSPRTSRSVAPERGRHESTGGN